MTTIAGNQICIVTDSAVTDGDQVWLAPKAERINGDVYATAGSAADGEKFYEWARNKRKKKPKLAEAFDALWLCKKGLFLYDHDLEAMKLANPHAIGSGGKACRAAMLAGADISAAVTIVCSIDANSSLPVQVYMLDEVVDVATPISSPLKDDNDK